MADSNAVALLGVALTAAGFAFGLYQYRINSIQTNLARRRKRAVMATTQTREFFADPNVRFMMELLDYSLAPFVDDTLKQLPPYTKDNLVKAIEVYWQGDKAHEGTTVCTKRFAPKTLTTLG
ncbi:hypothetical protein [Bradyrhizobium sp.]